MARRLFVLLFTAAALASRFTPAMTTFHQIPEDALRLSTSELSASTTSQTLARIIGNENQNSSVQAHLPRALQRLTKVLDEAEKQQATFQNNQGRFLGINRGGRFRGLLVVWLPVSFVLPTLKRQKYQGYYRSADSVADEPMELNDIAYNPGLKDYKFDRNYGPLLSRLDAYFGMLGIEELPCRSLLLCYASQEPITYQPVSDLFTKLMQRSEAFQRPTHYHQALKRFFTYYWANKKGRTYKELSQCDQEYASCPWTVDQMIRTDMLRFWQTLSRRFAIQLEDE